MISGAMLFLNLNLVLGTCILFLFLFQITFFTACLALAGEHEAEGRSGLTLRPVHQEQR